jgi:hypothetical protein
MPLWCGQGQIFVQNYRTYILASSDTRTYYSTSCDPLPYAPAITQILFCLAKCTVMLQCESWNKILSVLLGFETRFRMYPACVGYAEVTGSCEHVDGPDL